MTAHRASLLNAVILIVCSIWAYFASDGGSLTIFIPAAFGVALIACNPGIKAENKVVAHIAVTLTLITFLALFVPLRGVIASGDAEGVIRVVLMMASCVFAKVYFIKSFRDARRAREAGNA
ncbi:MAG: hypothetical protein AAFY06_01395 [Pseudomonadota bacterium]